LHLETLYSEHDFTGAFAVASLLTPRSGHDGGSAQQIHFADGALFDRHYAPTGR
jgi:hypothetical protein